MRGRCGTDRCGGINGECEESRHEALVAMVHTTDLGDGDDFSDVGLSLLGIPSESDIERSRIAIELTRVSETGSDLKHSVGRIILETETQAPYAVPPAGDRQLTPIFQ